MTPRTKAGASLIASYPSVVSEAASPAFIRHQARAIRAIEDEMLDKVAAAVDAMPWEYRGVDVVMLVKRAIEDIRKEASDGR